MMKIASNAIVFGAGLLALSAYGIAAPSSGSQAPTTSHVGSVITGKKAPEVLSDRELTRRVEMALDSDRYVYAEHVVVTSADGVVTLQGLVADESDLQGAIRIARRVGGVKSVVDELEIEDFGTRGRG
jgi:osmotically-inducible protein OsmY